MTNVTLHRLTGTKKALEACRLVERLYLAGTRTVVWVSDAGRAGTLDEYLWTFAQHSFVPHSLWAGKGDCDDPVVVATGALGNPNGATALVIVDRLADPALAAGFSEVHDIVAQSPEDEGKASAWAQAGFAVADAGPRR